MRIARLGLAWLAGGLAAAGALATLLLADGSRSRFDDLAIAAVILTYTAVGLVLSVTRPQNRVGAVILLGAVAWGLGEGLIAGGLDGLTASPGSATYTTLAVIGTAARGLGWLFLVLVLPVVFPDGRAESRLAARLALACVVAFTAGSLFTPVPLEVRLADTENPIGVPDAWVAVTDTLAIGAIVLSGVGIVLAIRSLVRRWRRGDELRRQQVLVFAMAFALPLLLLPFMPTPWVEPWMFALVTLPIPVAVAVAVLQRRLYDLPLALNRTLTYLLLSAVLAVLYASVVAGVGIMLRDRGAAWLPLVAAGVVAVAFAPVRDSLQRAANRLTYGRWSAPAEVLGETGRRLADAADGPALLRTLTDEVVDGLGLSRAEVRDGAGRLLASSGPPGESTARLPLTAYGEPVGALCWSGRALRPSERTLMADLANQIGGVVHTAALLEDLRRAQEQLVLAGEQERRRLRNDLHDGLGPSLAGLGLKVDTVQTLLADGRPTGDLLVELRRGLRETVAEVRRIVEGLRPPAIDELGLFGAVAELGRELALTSGLALDLDLPEEHVRLPAAVEVAAYRVAQEAITNVVRHAHASSCRVAATVSDRALVLAVHDDGDGGAAPRGGIGLRSMHERAHAIGGTVEICSAGSRDSAAPGTRVTLRLPLEVP